MSVSIVPNLIAVLQWHSRHSRCALQRHISRWWATVWKLRFGRVVTSYRRSIHSVQPPYIQYTKHVDLIYSALHHLHHTTFATPVLILLGWSWVASGLVTTSLNSVSRVRAAHLPPCAQQRELYSNYILRGSNVKKQTKKTFLGDLFF